MSKQDLVARNAIAYPAPSDEPKGYVHWNNAESVQPSLGDVCPGRVKVYMNLKLMCLSLLNARTGKLYCHVHNVSLRNAKFRVQQAGRRRVLKEKRKNVHAYILGDLVDVDMGYIPDLVDEGWHSAHYDPYKSPRKKEGYFRDEPSLRVVNSADEVLVFDRTAIGYKPFGNIFYRNEEKK